MNSIYNIDLVGAKTGKQLTKGERLINYFANLITTRLTQALVIAFVLIILYKNLF